MGPGKGSGEDGERRDVLRDPRRSRGPRRRRRLPSRLRDGRRWRARPRASPRALKLPARASTRSAGRRSGRGARPSSPGRSRRRGRSRRTRRVRGGCSRGASPCGGCETIRTTSAVRRPRTTPTTPPSAVSVIASVRNWREMSRRSAPSALRRPISFVRSVTETSMMFITPTPPTTRAIAAMRTMTPEIAFVTACICAIIFSAVKIAKSFGVLKGTFRRARSTIVPSSIDAFDELGRARDRRDVDRVVVRVLRLRESAGRTSRSGS